MSTQSHDTRPVTPATTENYSVKQAAAILGKSSKTVLRWIKDGSLAANKQPTTKGDKWFLTPEAVAKTASEKGITLDLTDDDLTDVPTASGQNEDLVQALNDLGDLREQVGQMSGQNEQLSRQNSRLSSDNDHLRAEYERTQQELVESERARGQLEGELGAAEKLRATEAQERDSLDLQHRELEKASAESISALSGDLESTKSDAEKLVGERDELAAKLAEAEGSMGWWTRRRYQR